MERRQAIVYCIVPRELAPALHERLRRHFRDDPSVEVIVERRGGDRRSGADRRGTERERGGEERVPGEPGAGKPRRQRRRIRARAGRRVAERRVAVAPVEPPSLPRAARPFAERLTFVERLEPSSRQREDIDTLRLVARLQAGEREVFSDIYTRYFDRVYGYMRLVFRQHQDAEDAAQQVFTKVFEALPRYERRGQQFGAWLYTIVRHQALDELKRRSRSELVDPAELGAHDNAGGEREEHALDPLEWIADRELLMFVERLPLSQRQVLALRYMLDLPAADVARVLGRSHDDVRMLHSRALRQLRARLAAVGRGPTERGRIRMRAPLRQARVMRRRRAALLYRRPGQRVG